jgi:hypothetical protein
MWFPLISIYLILNLFILFLKQGVTDTKQLRIVEEILDDFNKPTNLAAW